ncbi:MULTISPECIES: hypothetical protein [unclassified Janthinobacterium]|uniref:hypothetical protein n=1 Tax=unclassified Janthinobacterium TaxID=2610881 RepID=UPI001622D17D|nr:MULTISPECIES: hypothetical protein [unclassified Janthinobacterium]MBB5606201.1 hypothetical protein [Janthinobacterium sp. S3T4]MBB5611927.1 hypothetical protein [Janthinobacterium sp. S3M3]
MKLKIAMIAAISITCLTACLSPQPRQTIQQETNACMNYRAMMTAPMAPDAMQRLKMECEQSREHEAIKNTCQTVSGC